MSGWKCNSNNKSAQFEMIPKNEHKIQNLKTLLCKSQTYYGDEKDF